MLATQLKYDLLMFSRELFYMIFTIIIPPVTYIFMGQLFGDQTYAGNLKLCRNVYTVVHLTHHIRRHLFRFRIRPSDESYNRRRKANQSFTCTEKYAFTFRHHKVYHHYKYRFLPYLFHWNACLPEFPIRATSIS